MTVSEQTSILLFFIFFFYGEFKTCKIGYYSVNLQRFLPFNIEDFRKRLLSGAFIALDQDFGQG